MLLAFGRRYPLPQGGESRDVRRRGRMRDEEGAKFSHHSFEGGGGRQEVVKVEAVYLSSHLVPEVITG